MVPRLLTLFIAVASIVAAGCGEKSSPLVGKYKGVFKGKSNSPIKSMADSSSIEIKEGGRFNMLLLAEQSGYWTLEGNILSITAERIGKVDVPEKKRYAMKFKVSPDNKTLTLIEGSDEKTFGIDYEKM